MQQNKKIFMTILLILVILSIIFIFPFIWMIFSSFKSPAEVSALPPSLFVPEMDLSAYTRLFAVWDFPILFRNTMILVAFAFFGILLSAMTGYGFSKFDFRFKEIIFLLVLATLMIPAQVNMIPNFILITNLGLSNTFLAMALPGLVSGFAIFLFRQFMSTIPDEILEAARIEGLGEIQIFFRIILPMSKPILSIQAILAFIGAWNAFLWPLIVAQTPDRYTLSLGLSLTQGQNTSDIPLSMAGATIMVIPILIVFFFFQKYIMDGYNISGIK